MRCLVLAAEGFVGGSGWASEPNAIGLGLMGFCLDEV